MRRVNGRGCQGQGPGSSRLAGATCHPRLLPPTTSVVRATSHTPDGEDEQGRPHLRDPPRPTSQAAMPICTPPLPALPPPATRPARRVSVVVGLSEVIFCGCVCGTAVISRIGNGQRRHTRAATDRLHPTVRIPLEPRSALPTERGTPGLVSAIADAFDGGARGWRAAPMSGA
eukprot:1094876-Rhodomonas_salina.1